MKKITIALLALLLTLSTQAQETSLLWKVSGKGLAQPSWLYGTYHLLCKEDIHFSPATTTALSNSKTLYLEIDMADSSFAAKLMPMLAPNPAYNLSSHLSPEDFAVFSRFVQDSFHMSVEALVHLKPVVLMSLFIARNLPCPASGVEQELMQLAKNAHIPVEGLETVEDQMSVFNKIPDSVQMVDIIRDIKDPVAAKARDEKFKNNYKAGDIAALFDDLMETTSMAGYADLMVFQRNRNWIPVIEKAMAGGSNFFAFGAGHLGGEEGVIKLLRKAGYTVEPVK
ncbi:TraB/GumN family protein [Chitinophaga sp. sic0106]|uniref:TraB/GumN family protein n=1 Tax=Chitinophaga sp. sic0106 TaxID=2854785 RepID=UPI001C46579E|nr:TraB/GumN family protein [Chitinophaga sp. sic0106]MBV7533213.1 TraB/GumN family protein [Chitinophaga sp. sic0106]